jgi:hypothetical protein
MKQKIISKNKVNVPDQLGSSVDHVTYKLIQINENVFSFFGVISRWFQVCSSAP